jgi:hypothetical protein
MAKPQKGDEERLKAQMTEENYRQWLGQFSDQQKVGVAKNTDRRPLANFMTEQVGHKAIVMPMRTSIGNCHFMNPPWAQAYVHDIDLCPPNNIVKTRALQVLDDLDWRFGDRMD